MNDKSKKQPSHDALVVQGGKGDEVYFHKVGVAFPAKDGDLSLVLHSAPMNGKLYLSKRKDEALKAVREKKSQKKNHEYYPDFVTE